MLNKSNEWHNENFTDGSRTVKKPKRTVCACTAKKRKRNDNKLFEVCLWAMAGLTFMSGIAGLVKTKTDVHDKTGEKLEEITITTDIPATAMSKTVNDDNFVTVDVFDGTTAKKSEPALKSPQTSAKQVKTPASGASKTAGKQALPRAASATPTGGRANPFAPARGYVAATSRVPSSISAGSLNFDLINPPTDLEGSQEIRDLMTTKVSGILYDRSRPSAIINVKGTDILVRTGDVIGSYRVLSITKDKVSVKDGANVYQAGVGEPLGVAERPVPTATANIESKFGGSYKRQY